MILLIPMLKDLDEAIDILKSRNVEKAFSVNYSISVLEKVRNELQEPIPRPKGFK